MQERQLLAPSRQMLFRIELLPQNTRQRQIESTPICLADLWQIHLTGRG